MISRPFYIDWLKRWANRNVIKVITGMRRSGKSTIMELFQQDLRESGVLDSNIISINFESLDERYPLTAKELYDYVVAQLATKGVTYVFLDEVQQVAEFEKAVNALFVRNDVDLYITGSNAYLLSSELATLLTGRYVEIGVHPLTFKEYFSAVALSKEEAFNHYITYGGLPYAATLREDRDITEYLDGVFSTILIKDIAQRRPRMDMRSFEATASFLADNIGNISSIKRIADALAARNNKISQGAIGEYINLMLQSFLAFQVRRFDLKGKDYLQTQEKYYLGDLGFRFWLLGKSAGDVGRRIENVVYLELLRRYGRVAIGKQAQQEIDFVVPDGQATSYFQVAQTVLDETVLQRELAPLKAIEDNYPKILLTLDTIGTGDFSGIKHINLLDWLLE